MTQSKSTKTTGVSAGTKRVRTARVRRAEAIAEPSPSPTPGATRPQTKQALVTGLLQRPGGAALKDLMTATGWLAHTTRAALTRLRQAGHRLDKSTGEAGTVYRIAMPVRPARSRKAA
jgi:hypothetical protein